MKFTECLNTEHGVFLTQLEVLENMLKCKTHNETLRAIILTIASAVERHRIVEEKLLYSAILREFGENFPPIQVMEMEHKEIEKCIKGIVTEENDVPTLAKTFINVLRQHIVKEINILFPVAEQRISTQELEEMTSQGVQHYHDMAGVKSSGEMCYPPCT